MTEDTGWALYAALRALVMATERMDNPGDMGVGTDADEMIAARAALEQARPGWRGWELRV